MRSFMTKISFASEDYFDCLLGGREIIDIHLHSSWQNTQYSRLSLKIMQNGIYVPHVRCTASKRSLYLPLMFHDRHRLVLLHLLIVQQCLHTTLDLISYCSNFYERKSLRIL